MTDLDAYPWRLTEDSTVWNPNALELDLISMGVNGIAAELLRYRNRVVEIFEEFDGLRGELTEARAQLTALDHKLDLVLAALPLAGD